jgi:ABC-2 type transport system permease protein
VADILHILRFKIIIFLKTSFRFRPETILKIVASTVVFGGFSVAAFFFSRRVTGYLLDEAHIGLFLFHRFFSMMLYVFFLSVNVGNLIVSYASLYRSRETMFFLTKPISHARIFIVKFIDNFFYSSVTLFLMVMAVVAGYGAHFNLPFLFYPAAVIFLILPYMLISAALAAAMLLALIFIAGKIGARTVFGAVILGYVALVFAYFKMTDPMQLAESVLKLTPYGLQDFAFLDSPFLKMLPNHWVAEALYWTVKGEPYGAAGYVALLFAACAGSLIGMALLGKHLYYRSWLVSLELRTTSEVTRSRPAFFSLTRKSWFEPQVAVLLKKELWQFFREPSQWIHLAIISFLIFVFIFSLVRLDLTSPQPFMQTVLYLVVYAFAAFLIASISLRFVFPMVGIEGENFWAVRSAPVSLSRVYIIKFMLVIVPVLVISEILGVAAHQSLRYYGVLLDTTIVNIFVMALALVSMNLGLGTYYADFKEVNPIKASSSQGATLTFLLSIVYMVMLVAVMVVPLNQYFEAMIRGVPMNVPLILTGLGVAGVVSVIISILSHIVGLRAIRRER